MAGRLARALDSIGEFVRAFFSGRNGVGVATRDADGTFGTQRMHIKQRATDRQERYPAH